MSSQIEELKPLSGAKGTIVRLFIDHSKPEDSLDHNWAEATFDGLEDSPVFAVPRHWHRDHDEYMEVLEGRVLYYLDDKETVLSAGDPPLFIPRGHVHSLSTIKGERARFTERNAPGGNFKALFFQDLMYSGDIPNSFWLMMRIFYDGDGYPALPPGIKALDYAFVSIMGLIAKPFVRAKPTRVMKMGE